MSDVGTPPDYFAQVAGLSPGERKAWLRTQSAEFWNQGMAWVRASYNEEHDITVLDGWRVQPEREAPPRVYLQALA